MNLAAEANPFADHQQELPPELVQSNAPSSQDDHTEGDQRGYCEPGSLIERRSNREFKRRACFVPDALTVGRDDAEGVLSRREIRINSQSSHSCVGPIGIESFETIADPGFERRGEIQYAVPNFKLAVLG